MPNFPNRSKYIYTIARNTCSTYNIISTSMADLFAQLDVTSNSPNITALLSQLPKAKWLDKYDLYQWNGSWYFSAHIESTLAFQTNFTPRDDDIIIASSPKTGTTWLKALINTIVANGCDDEQDLLTEQNPHGIIKSLEGLVYLLNPTADLSVVPSPRIFHTHLPFDALPDSIKGSKCKIVYIARNPKDTFVSLWHFLNTLRPPEEEMYPIGRAFDDFCNGVHFFGPYNDHVLEYWKNSLQIPEKIHFMTYEGLKKEPKEQVKVLGEFLDKPFVKDEEVDMVLWSCSIERLENLEVNVSGSFPFGLKHSTFFRLGVVGDWKNCFTEEMCERLNHITRLKFEGSGLNFETGNEEQ